MITSMLRGLPTEEYYHLLRKWYQQNFPEARADVIEHIAELEEFFDVSISIGFSWESTRWNFLRRKSSSLARS